MSAYENLARYYSDIFPLSEKLCNFLNPLVEQCQDTNKAWLDVGAGTGNLIVWLEENHVEAHGLEPDPDFVAEAQRRLNGSPERIVRGALQDLGNFYGSGQFGAITCLGNVLAHVDSLDEVRAFFSHTASLLASGGAAIVQVVNFDRVLARRTWEFPVLKRNAADGTPIDFQRAYTPQGEHLLFTTALHAGGVEYQNEVRLLPLHRADLMDIAKTCFDRVDLFGDYGSPWSLDAPATILYVTVEPES
ncbi:class I SAM-dependent methyltransferase [bacterium]|nr:class I SAM-dependent methyltransferase [bacterium]